MLTPLLLFGLAGVGISLLTIAASRRVTRRWLSRSVAALAGGLLLIAAFVVGWAIFLASGDRSPETIALGSTVSYERIALGQPNRQVLHVATADLDNACLSLVTSKPGPFGFIGAETGTEFVERTGAALAINVAFFRGLDEYPLWDSYPETGEIVQAIGPVVIDGELLGDVYFGGDQALAITDGQLSASERPAAADLAVRGRIPLVANGEVVAPDSRPYPRAVAGVDRDTNQLILVVSDGKQPGYATGSTYQGIAEFLVERGVDEALEFDGGGSATMAGIIDGEVELLNRPSHQRIPGRQRHVATHLGIMIDPSCG